MPPDLNSEVILYNNALKINDKSLFYKEWYDKGVFYKSDLLRQSKRLLTYDKFTSRYNIPCDFLSYYQLVNAIPKD